jgi:exportin-1
MSTIINNPNTDATTLKSIINIIKTNVAVCKPVGPIFRTELQTISPFLSQCYQMSSTNLQQSQEQLCRRIRQLTLELLEVFILSNEYLELQDQSMLSALIQSILLDYKNALNTEHREAQVLSLLTSMFEKMQASCLFCLN